MPYPPDPSSERAALYPLLVRGAAAEPRPDKPDELLIQAPGLERRVVLGAAAWDVVRTFDGTRSTDQLAQDLLARGVPLPPGDFVADLARGLARVGLVTLMPRALPTKVEDLELVDDVVCRAPLRHRCDGTGGCCEGHRIGPLDDAFRERLPDVLEALGDPRPVEGPGGVVEVGEIEGRTVAWLRAREDGRCAFLEDGGGCRIHGALGAAAKPLVCRLFPAVFVRTEDGVRVGVTPRCYGHHRTFAAAPAQELPVLTGVPAAELPPPLVRGLDPAAPRRFVLAPRQGSLRHFRAQLEKHLLALLDRPGTTLEDVFAFLYETVCRESHPGPLPGFLADPRRGAVLAERLRVYGARLRDGELLPPEGSSGGLHAAALRRLVATLVGLESCAFDGLSEAQRSYTFRGLTDWIFLREWYHCGSIRASAVAFLVGAVVAQRAAAAAGEDPVDGEVGDVFAHTLTAWVRAMGDAGRFSWLFDDTADLERFMHAMA